MTAVDEVLLDALRARVAHLEQGIALARELGVSLVERTGLDAEDFGGGWAGTNERAVKAEAEHGAAMREQADCDLRTWLEMLRDGPCDTAPEEVREAFEKHDAAVRAASLESVLAGLCLPGHEANDCGNWCGLGHLRGCAAVKRVIADDIAELASKGAP